MSAKRPVDLADYRARQRRRTPAKASSPRRPSRTAVTVSAHPGAVSMVVPQPDNWLSPKRAHELGEDLIRMAVVAQRASKSRS